MNTSKLQHQENQDVGVIQFKCNACGGHLVFDPASQELACQFCGNVQSLTESKIVSEKTFDESSFLVNEFETGEVEIYRCDNCGSISEKSTDGLAFHCPYCKSINVVLDKDIKGIKPTGVIPFKVDEAQVAEIAKKWIKGRFFAPSKIKKTRFDTFFKGIYSPCWTFDSQTTSTYHGRVGYHYTVTVGSGKNRRTVRKTRWKMISGNLDYNFDDVKINAGNKVSDKAFSEIANYETNNANDYKKEFLAGFSAMHYSVGVKEAWNEAKEEIRSVLYDEIKSNSRADVVSYINISTDYSQSTYKYLLLPFWLGQYYYNEKNYGAVVNGQSGAIWGSYPKSPLKIAVLSLISLALIGGVAYFLSNW